MVRTELVGSVHTVDVLGARGFQLHVAGGGGGAGAQLQEALHDLYTVSIRMIRRGLGMVCPYTGFPAEPDRVLTCDIAHYALGGRAGQGQGPHGHLLGADGLRGVHGLVGEHVPVVRRGGGGVRAVRARGALHGLHGIQGVHERVVRVVCGR